MNSQSRVEWRVIVLCAVFIVILVPCADSVATEPTVLEQLEEDFCAGKYDGIFARALLLAETADVRAQVIVGYLYAAGIGIEQDYAKSKSWWARAALQGDGEAEFHLGQLYEFGNGVEQNYKEAFPHYLRASEAGFELAQVQAGRFLLSGIGVPQDIEAATEWLTKAADQGYAGAFLELGRVHFFGVGANRDLAQAERQLRNALKAVTAPPLCQHD